MAKFNILNKTEKVVDYTLTITDKAPKKLRCDIIPELRKTSFCILESVIRANCCDISNQSERAARLSYQKDIITAIRVFETYAESSIKITKIS